MITKKAPKKAKSAEEKYSLTFTQAGVKTIESSGKTLLEALQSAKRPLKITTKMLLTVKNGKRGVEQNLTVPMAKRIFYPAIQTYLAKQLERLLK